MRRGLVLLYFSPTSVFSLSNPWELKSSRFLGNPFDAELALVSSSLGMQFRIL